MSQHHTASLFCRVSILVGAFSSLVSSLLLLLMARGHWWAESSSLGIAMALFGAVAPWLYIGLRPYERPNNIVDGVRFAILILWLLLLPWMCMALAVTLVWSDGIGL